MVRDAARRTLSSQELSATTRLDEVLADDGSLDIEGSSLDDEALMAVLADAANATDRELRQAARDAAAGLAISLASRSDSTVRGPRRAATVRADRAEGDLDIDRSLPGVALAKAAGHPPRRDDLWVETRRDQRVHLCLVVDRSGSMAGERLATAAVTAAACVLGAARQRQLTTSVLLFNNRCVVLAEPSERRSVNDVIDDVLTLRGAGSTDLASAALSAGRRHAREAADRYLSIVVSDCAWNEGDDPRDALGALARLGPLSILIPAGADPEGAARRLGDDVGAMTRTGLRATTVANELAAVAVAARLTR